MPTPTTTSSSEPRFRVVPQHGYFTVEDTRSGERIGFFRSREKAETQCRLQEVTAKLFPGDKP